MGFLPPPPEDHSGIQSLGTYGKSPLAIHAEQVPSSNSRPVEEGSPEEIRQRYFPSEVPPEENPSLAWMLNAIPSPHLQSGSGDLDAGDELTVTRYSLSGTHLTPSEIRDLPTHLGLHHHAATGGSLTDNPAGYTLSDLLLLSRSSVPAQRASILGVLASILKNTSQECYGGSISSGAEFLEKVKELNTMRRDIHDAAVNALGEKGGVGLRAMDAFWEAIVGVTLQELSVTQVNQAPFVDFSPSSNTPPPSPDIEDGVKPSRILSPQSVTFLSSIPLVSTFPALRSHLIVSRSPQSVPHAQILDVLILLARFPHHASVIVDKQNTDIISLIMNPHLRSSYSFEVTDEPVIGTMGSIHLLQMLTRTGRQIASSILGPADVVLRYLATPFPSLDQADAHPDEIIRHLDLARETLVLYTLLAQYGFYSHIATTAQMELAQVASWILAAVLQTPTLDVLLLARSYVEFLEALITCAHDPHKTTPPHEILWSQVEGWRWGDWILNLFEGLGAIFHDNTNGQIQSKAIETLLSSIFNALAAWMEGASVNGVRGGEQEKTILILRLSTILQENPGINRIVQAASAMLQEFYPKGVANLNDLQNISQASHLLLGINRLSLQRIDQPFSGPDYQLALGNARGTCIRFADERILEQILHHNLQVNDDDALIFLRSISNLMVVDLRMTLLKAAGSTLEMVQWMRHTFSVLNSLLPGDEWQAKVVIKILCQALNPTILREGFPSIPLVESWAAESADILLPFFFESLVPSTDAADEDDAPQRPHCIAPLRPLPDSISTTSTLLMPSLSKWRRNWNACDPSTVLPLRNDWPIWPLNHLLRSGSSQVFKKLPPTWDATETDIVRTSLVLSLITQRSEGSLNHSLPATSMSRAQTIFACMKVFMLEHGQQQIDSGVEVFRDPLVSKLMEELLFPFALSQTQRRTTVEVESSVEVVSKAFLGVQTPFYQFYTDFIALSDAISFSFPLFGRLLLPPVSMSYELDYRKLLFGDYNHVLRTIKVEPADIYTNDVREYLWPVESDRSMIGWYLKTVTTAAVGGFLRWMAVHHIASNIWPDLGEKDVPLDRANKILKALVARGNPEVTKEVVWYTQTRETVKLPPACYGEGSAQIGQQRLDFIVSMADADLEARLKGLFMTEARNMEL